MSECNEVERPLLQQLATLGWTVVAQGFATFPQEPAASLRTSFREWLLPGVFDAAVRRINTLPDDKPWLTERQLDDLRSQLLRHRNKWTKQSFPSACGFTEIWPSGMSSTLRE